MALFYVDRSVAFLTQHGKESLIGPLLQDQLGCRVVRADGYDTDRLGTFSGEVPRLQSQLQTVRRKARIGMDLLGSPLGLASEGAFVPDPFGGLMPWNVEMLVWIDDERNLEVTGVAQGPARSLQRNVRNESELTQFAREAGFPQHHLLMRPEGVAHPRVRKGLADHDMLLSAYAACRQESPKGQVWVENDLRAFCNPTRQAMIVRAAHDLVNKLRSHCPSCDWPGYAVTERQPGLPCRACGLPTALSKALIWRCAGCGHTEVKPAGSASHADPSRCDHCNP
ncbi:MAG: hypothetical protein RL657_1106 [Pseudomonadota bacterium]|jgi:hypothetical protein